MRGKERERKRDGGEGRRGKTENGAKNEEKKRESDNGERLRRGRWRRRREGMRRIE